MFTTFSSHAEERRPSDTCSRGSTGRTLYTERTARAWNGVSSNAQGLRHRPSTLNAANATSFLPKHGNREETRHAKACGVSNLRIKREFHLNKRQPPSSKDECCVCVEDFPSDDSRVSPAKPELQRHVFCGDGFEIFWLAPRVDVADKGRSSPSPECGPIEPKAAQYCDSSSSPYVHSSRTSSTRLLGGDTELQCLAERARAVLKRKEGLSTLLQLSEEIFSYLRASLKHSRTKEKALLHAVKQLKGHCAAAPRRKEAEAAAGRFQGDSRGGEPRGRRCRKLPEAWDKRPGESKPSETQGSLSVSELLTIPPHPWSIRCVKGEVPERLGASDRCVDESEDSGWKTPRVTEAADLRAEDFWDFIQCTYRGFKPCAPSWVDLEIQRRKAGASAAVAGPSTGAGSSQA